MRIEPFAAGQVTALLADADGVLVVGAVVVLAVVLETGELVRIADQTFDAALAAVMLDLR